MSGSTHGRFEDGECEILKGDGFSMTDTDEFVICACERKMSFQCLRCLRHALLDALMHVGKSIDSVHDPDGVWRDLYDGIETSNCSTAAGVGGVRRSGRLKKCIVCEDGIIPEETARRAPAELLTQKPDLDPAVDVVPYVEVQAADGSVTSLYALVEQVDAWPVVPQAMMDDIFKGDSGAHDAVGGMFGLLAARAFPARFPRCAPAPPPRLLLLPLRPTFTCRPSHCCGGRRRGG